MTAQPPLTPRKRPGPHALTGGSNSVEGALRIELAPMIGKIVAQEIAAAPPARPGLARGLVLGLAIALAFALGVAASVFYRIWNI